MTVLPITAETTVGQLVAERPARSRVFQKLGIDFCCGGKKRLAEACQAKGLDPQTVLQVLWASETAQPGAEVDAATMSLTALCDHIASTHHAYLQDELPRLERMIHKVAAVHGERFPWMVEVRDVFSDFQRDLDAHLAKEEEILFPAIRAMERGEPQKMNGADSLGQAIAGMEHEHEGAGSALEQFRRLTGHYTPPADACNTFRAALDGLAQLEADMHQHVHKENNVLFPRALALEAHPSALASPA